MMKAVGDSETYYAVRPECLDNVPKAHFKPKSGKMLSTRRWHAAFTPEGYLDMGIVLSRIQRGLMWAMEYNPNIFSLYQDSASPAADPSIGMKGNDKTLEQYGKFERKYAKTGAKDPQSALSIFLIASVLEQKHKRLMKEILDDVTGSLDVKKACNEALKLHKKYLNKTKKP